MYDLAYKNILAERKIHSATGDSYGSIPPLFKGSMERYRQNEKNLPNPLLCKEGMHISARHSLNARPNEIQKTTYAGGVTIRACEKVPSSCETAGKQLLRSLRKTICIVMLFAVATVAWAKDDIADLTNMSIENLMGIKVYGASKFEQKSSEAPASVRIVTAEEIRKYGYRTLADILRSMRGFLSVQEFKCQPKEHEGGRQ